MRIWESAAMSRRKRRIIVPSVLNLYHLIDTFKASRTLEDFNVLLGAYISLAEMLGFSEEQIERAYVEKNEVNYERQRQGY
ncbi:hypothetical protein B14911_05916 [Bacillus sp. NRRL B-14911]|nr:hypothetical protein B14911_05916 [Bacillus sp. NRRL B-14911]